MNWINSVLDNIISFVFFDIAIGFVGVIFFLIAGFGLFQAICVAKDGEDSWLKTLKAFICGGVCFAIIGWAVAIISEPSIFFHWLTIVMLVPFVISLILLYTDKD